jgi:hypothetical protein
MQEEMLGRRPTVAAKGQSERVPSNLCLDRHCRSYCTHCRHQNTTTTTTSATTNKHDRMDASQYLNE